MTKELPPEIIGLVGIQLLPIQTNIVLDMCYNNPDTPILEIIRRELDLEILETLTKINNSITQNPNINYSILKKKMVSYFTDTMSNLYERLDE